jgi:hypothetical protein
MCDFSLYSVKSRPAKVGDKLTTQDFGTGTRGFAAQEDLSVAVCIRPGTELSFADEVRCLPTGLFAWRGKTIAHKTAIFRQVNKARLTAHHDALEFPDGQIVLLTALVEVRGLRFFNYLPNPRLQVRLRPKNAPPTLADRQRCQSDRFLRSPCGRERCRFVTFLAAFPTHYAGDS